MWSKIFWKDAVERLVKTAAQAEAAYLVAAGTGLLTVNWWASLSTAGMAAVLSLLTSLGSNVVNPTGTASLITMPGGHAPFAPGGPVPGAAR